MQCNAEEFLRSSLEAGFRTVEFRSSKIEEYLNRTSHRKLTQLLQELHMRVAGLNGLEFFSLVPKDNDAFILKRAEVQLHLCQLFGITHLILVPSMRIEGMDQESVIKRTAETTSLILDIAKKMGIRLALEIVGNPAFSLRKVDEALQVLNMINDDHLSLALDNICLYEGLNEINDLRRIPVDKIAIVHANDVRKKEERNYGLQDRIFPGEGDLDLTEFYRILKEKNYRGPVSVELFNEEVWKMPPRAAARLAWKSIQQFLV
jgi:4-hydroxyphenylpyruvate dioxygenase